MSAPYVAPKTKDLSGELDVIGAQDFLKVMNDSPHIKDSLGEGFMIRHIQWGDQDYNEVKMEPLHPVQVELLLEQAETKVKGVPFGPFNLKTTAVFQDELEAGILTNLAAKAVHTLSDVVNRVVRNYEEYTYTNRELRFGRAINIEWDKPGGAASRVGPMTCEYVQTGSRFDIVVEIASVSLNTGADKGARQVKYVITAELKCIRAKKEPTADSPGCNDICHQLASYANMTVKAGFIPLANMLIYTVNRRVNSRPSPDTHEIATGVQAHSFWWPMKQVLYRYYPNDQKFWGGGFLPSEVAADAFELSESQEAINAQLDEEAPSEDDGMGGGASARGRSGSRNGSRGRGGSNASGGGSGSRGRGGSAGGNGGAAGGKAAAVPQKRPPPMNRPVVAKRPKPAAAPPKPLMSAQELRENGNRDPSKYSTSKNFNADGVHFHGLDPKNLKGDFIDMQKMFFLTGEEWLVLEDEIPRPTPHTTSMLLTEISEETSLIWKFAAVKSRSVDNYTTADSPYQRGTDQRGGRWTVGRIEKVDMGEEYVSFNIVFPGWTRKKGGVVTFELLCVRDAVGGLKIVSDGGVFTSETEISTRDTGHGNADFCIFTDEAVRLEDTTYLHHVVNILTTQLNTRPLESREVRDFAEQMENAKTNTRIVVEKLVTLEHENSDLNRKILSMRVAEAAMNSSDEKTTELSNRIAGYEKKIRESSEQVFTLRTKNTDLQQNLSYITHENKEIYKRLNAQALDIANREKPSYEQKVADLTQQIALSARDMDRVVEEASTLRIENTELERIVSSMTGVNKDLDSRLTAQTAELARRENPSSEQQRITDLTKQIEDYETRLAEGVETNKQNINLSKVLSAQQNDNLRKLQVVNDFQKQTIDGMVRDNNTMQLELTKMRAERDDALSETQRVIDANTANMERLEAEESYNGAAHVAAIQTTLNNLERSKSGAKRDHDGEIARMQRDHAAKTEALINAHHAEMQMMLHENKVQLDNATSEMKRKMRDELKMQLRIDKEAMQIEFESKEENSKLETEKSALERVDKARKSAESKAGIKAANLKGITENAAAAQLREARDSQEREVSAAIDRTELFMHNAYTRRENDLRDDLRIATDRYDRLFIEHSKCPSMQTDNNPGKQTKWDSGDEDISANEEDMEGAAGGSSREVANEVIPDSEEDMGGEAGGSSRGVANTNRHGEAGADRPVARSNAKQRGDPNPVALVLPLLNDQGDDYSTEEEETAGYPVRLASTQPLHTDPENEDAVAGGTPPEMSPDDSPRVGDTQVYIPQDESPVSSPRDGVYSRSQSPLLLPRNRYNRNNEGRRPFNADFGREMEDRRQQQVLNMRLHAAWLHAERDRLAGMRADAQHAYDEELMLRDVRIARGDPYYSATHPPDRI
jgi:hypothetical protein